MRVAFQHTDPVNLIRDSPMTVVLVSFFFFSFFVLSCSVLPPANLSIECNGNLNETVLFFCLFSAKYKILFHMFLTNIASLRARARSRSRSLYVWRVSTCRPEPLVRFSHFVRFHFFFSMSLFCSMWSARELHEPPQYGMDLFRTHTRTWEWSEYAWWSRNVVTAHLSHTRII